MPSENMPPEFGSELISEIEITVTEGEE